MKIIPSSNQNSSFVSAFDSSKQSLTVILINSEDTEKTFIVDSQFKILPGSYTRWVTSFVEDDNIGYQKYNDVKVSNISQFC